MLRLFLKVSFVFIFSIYSAAGQDYYASDYIKELNVKFSSAELKRLEKGAQTMNTAATVPEICRRNVFRTQRFGKKGSHF
ncbi:MAG: hypothetical protein HC906_07545 [Bacteroidales bacterium]|nr:hypothetical protein [Bacteroidales bacterium]